MSKAARGTKRACESCGNKFYDLNRSPIVCPSCNTEFKLAKDSSDKKPEEVVKEAPPKEPAKPVEAEKKEAEIDPELATVDDDDLADLDDVETAETSDDEDDAFLPEEDEGDDDVSGLLGDTLPPAEEET